MIVMFFKPSIVVSLNKTDEEDLIKNRNSDLYAKVESFNKYGKLRIEFSEIMNTTLGFDGLNSEISSL